MSPSGTNTVVINTFDYGLCLISVTAILVSQHEQYQGQAKWNRAIINVINYTCDYTAKVKIAAVKRAFCALNNMFCDDYNLKQFHAFD